MYRGTVIRSESMDPHFKVSFSYRHASITINDGEAVLTRQSPVSKVVFSDYTDYLLEKFEADEATINNLKLEICNTVLDFLLNKSR